VSVRRGARGAGISVDPGRIREARRQAGLSLRELAGADVSATFIHFVERGVSRPSQKVLGLIARRTGKPISYFTAQDSRKPYPDSGLAEELARVASKTGELSKTNGLATTEVEALKLIEVTLRQAANVASSIDASLSRKSKG
jgi:transcriptional regulator with XRE-family HTH domain